MRSPLPLLSLFCCLILPLHAADVTLSPEGPISTPRAARDAARALEKPVRILVADGVYELGEPLELGPEDSGVLWEAAPGAKPVFSGGRLLGAWEAIADGLWMTPLPDPDWHFEQLWIDGRRATRARTPNQGFFHLDEAVAPGVFPDLETDIPYQAFRLPAEPYQILQSLSKEERGEVLLTVAHAWAVGQCRIADLNDEHRAVRIAGRSAYPFIEREPDQRIWMENYRAALDEAGEWYLDRRRGEVLYRPLEGQDMSRATAIAPRSEKLLLITGARDLGFRGISFRHAHYAYPPEGHHDRQAAIALGAAIEILDSRNLRFEACEVAHVGEYALFFKNGCADARVSKCHLHDLGGGGVRIGEATRPEDERVNTRIQIDNCIIQHGGRLHPSACGVVLTHTRHCAVTHCDIGDFYYSGISAGWNWGYGDTASRATLVENNHIHHLGWAYLSDMGGFYGLGISPGTVVRGNHIHHIASYRYGGWGLYTDEGSSDVTMENNLVHDTSDAAFHQHYGFFNTVRNNIFAFGGTGQIHRTRNEPHLTLRIERNLVVWNPDAPLFYGEERHWKRLEGLERGYPRDNLVFRRNLYWRTDGKIPDTLTKSHFTWEEWRRLGRDVDSRFADPGFVDLAARDFRLKPGSPAEEIGFQPWDLSLAGTRQDDPDWRALAEAGHHYPDWESKAKPWPAPVYRLELQTFDSVPPGTLGIRNANVETGGEGAGLFISEEAASPLTVVPPNAGKAKPRSLKLQDRAGLEKSYHPVLTIRPRWKEGRFLARFDLMITEGAQGFFEMRSSDGEFAAGPYVRWAGGRLVANNQNSIDLGPLATGEWVRIQISAIPGSGRYHVRLTREDGREQEFPDLPCKSTWEDAGQLIFSGTANADTAYFLDNLSLTREEIPTAP